MNHKLEQVRQSLLLLYNGSGLDSFCLFPGIELSFLTLRSDAIALRHDTFEATLEINYCRSGRMGWEMGNGNNVYLGPGDFSLHMMSCCADSTMTLPNGHYEGLILCIDLDELTVNPPELLSGTGITGETLRHKFCRKGALTSLAGNAETESVFSAFYGQPEALQSAYWKVKTLELLLYLERLGCSAKEQLTQYQTEQAETARKLHDQLVRHLDQRFTIEVLSRQYLMNPTTLKAVFKAVYGNSIAAHVKEHRMEHAARLLLETKNSVAEIAQAVGYENQSKFTAAFKEYFQALPTTYRKNRRP